MASAEQHIGDVTATGPAIVARLDRLPGGRSSFAATGIVGLGLFTIFYCNFNINVSFIQTCVQIRPGCTPQNAQASLTLPVCVYLAGYLVGGVALPPTTGAARAYRELVTDPRYRRRMLLLVAMWFTGYATVFGYSTGSTVVLTSLHFTAPVAGMISAVGGVGFFVQGLFSARYSEVLERRYWLPVGAAMTVLGSVVVATLGTSIGWAFIGSFLVFFGFHVWVPPTFALSAESFPTRIRSADFGLVEGLGVLGGAMGVLVIAPLVPRLSPLPALLLISGFLVVAAVLAQFTPRARNRMLEELSP